MPSVLELAAANALEAACEAPLGIIARVELGADADMITPALRAEQVIYRFRKELGDPRYAEIVVKLSPDDPDNELWLVKGVALASPIPGVVALNVEDL